MIIFHTWNTDMDSAPRDGAWILADLLEDYAQVIYADGDHWKTLIGDGYCIPVAWAPMPVKDDDDTLD